MTNPDRRQAESGFKQTSFLPEPDFNPTYPNPHTLPAEALKRMLSGERITQPSFGLTRWRLSAYIKSLEYLGWIIKRDDVPNPHGQNPIREYYLEAEVIQKIRGA